MIKIFCDSCKEEQELTGDFTCDVQVVEILTSINAKTMVEGKEKREGRYHICKKCYDKAIRPLIDDKKENKK